MLLGIEWSGIVNCTVNADDESYEQHIKFDTFLCVCVCVCVCVQFIEICTYELMSYS